ncbi:hypothetical protein ACWGKK_12790 [Streptomyces chartreusis]
MTTPTPPALPADVDEALRELAYRIYRSDDIKTHAALIGELEALVRLGIHSAETRPVQAHGAKHAAGHLTDLEIR